jgi:fibronectin-binding autotransporter adhesin
MSLRRYSCACIVATILLTFLHRVEAANILWDGTGSSWNSVTSWSLFSNATTPNPAAKPGASDTAIFNIENLNLPQTVNLNAAQAALGLFFSSTGPVSIVSGTGTNTLTLGSGGITVNSGAGINTITSAVSLSAPHTWINDSSSLLTVSGAVTHGSNALTIAGSGNTAINGALGAGNLALTKNGAGTLSLNAANNSNFSTDLLINAGSVSLGNAGALPGVPFVSESDLAFGPGSTGTFTLNGHSARVYEFSTNAVVGNPVVQNASSTPATFTAGKPFEPSIFAGVLRDGAGGGSLGLVVAGPLTLSGNNTYTGLTEVVSGLTLQSPTALGSPAGGTVLFSAAGLDLNGQTIAGESLTITSDSQLSNTSVTPASWSGNITSSGGVSDFRIHGIGDINLSGGFSHLGIGGVSLVKSGPNTLELSGTSDNDTVALTVTSGVVRLAKTSGAGVRAVDFDVFVDGGTVQLAGTGGNQIGGSVFLTDGSFDMNGRSETISGLTLNGSGDGGIGALVNNGSGDSVLTLSSGGIHIESFTRIGVTQSGATLTLDATFSPSVSDFQKMGLGTLILKRSNSDYGGTIFLTSGTIAVGDNNSLGGANLVFEGGAVRGEGSPRTLFNSMIVTSTGVVTGAVDLTLAGAISGLAGLTKNDAGRLTLTAANSYAGLTTVNGGTLAVNGSITGSVEVNSGATLAGSGAIGGAVTLNAGGTIAPGASSESLNVGSLSMSAGSSIVMEIGGTVPASQYDQLLASGALALDGTLEVSLINGFTPSAGASFDLFDGTISGVFDTLDLEPLGAGFIWNTSQLYTTGVLSVAAGQPGDFDLDGDVDGRDFLIWQRNTSVGDLGDWQSNYGVGAITASNIAVPEPSAIVLGLFGLYSLSRKRLYR